MSHIELHNQFGCMLGVQIVSVSGKKKPAPTQGDDGPDGDSMPMAVAAGALSPQCAQAIAELFTVHSRTSSGQNSHRKIRRDRLVIWDYHKVF